MNGPKIIPSSVTNTAAHAADRRVACNPKPNPATASANPIPPIGAVDVARCVNRSVDLGITRQMPADMRQILAGSAVPFNNRPLPQQVSDIAMKRIPPAN